MLAVEFYIADQEQIAPTVLLKYGNFFDSEDFS